MARETGRSDFRLLICDCEGTNPLDKKAIEKASGQAPAICGTELCRRELGQVQSQFGKGSSVLIGCTQEAPLFLETADDNGFESDLRFVNIREKAGWSKDNIGAAAGSGAGAKMGALIAEAMLQIPGPHAVPVASGGVVMVIGNNDVALEAARRLGQRMDVTLILQGGQAVLPTRTVAVPVFHCRAIKARGHLGAFEMEMECFAPMTPSSRQQITFGAPAAETTRSKCDIILDLRGGDALFPNPEIRDGYFNPDPGDPAALGNLLFDILDLVGEFEKPRYVEYDPSICAHSRNGIVGCKRCLDHCPAGAITPDGDTVLIDPHICAGCGACAGVCPTGAITYAMPRPDDLLRRMLTLLRAYEVGGGEAGGGKRPVLLLHDGDFGENMIDTMARHYDGLPANMLPIAVNALAQCGLDSLLAARVYGAGKTLVLAAPKDEEELAPLLENIALTNHILGELGFRDGGVEIILEADPEVANARLWAATSDHASDRTVAPRPAAFEPTAEKRTALNLALMALHRVAPEPRDEIDLPPGAPFGTVDIDVDNCTLCMACAGVCPTNALRDTPDYPRLSFVETACVQCGLCAATCPEKVIILRPRLGFTGAVRNTRVIKEEEPFDCIRCGEPFATKSMIDAVTERMTSHSMFPNDKALRRLKMCADCRVIDMAETSPDPMAGAARPRVRTTDEYISGRYTDEDDDE